MIENKKKIENFCEKRGKVKCFENAVKQSGRQKAQNKMKARKPMCALAVNPQISKGFEIPNFRDELRQAKSTNRQCCFQDVLQRAYAVCYNVQC